VVFCIVLPESPLPVWQLHRFSGFNSCQYLKTESNQKRRDDPIVRESSIPQTPKAERFLAHAALRLTCNHQGFLPLWRDQLGDLWRERSLPQSWPVISKTETRWRLRAAMDAVVATAYGLDRADYAHILGSFSHRSFQSASAFCLAAFDALGTHRLDAFCSAQDPYFDIPSVTAFAQPVIDLSVDPDAQQNLKLDQRRSG
jgi:hypothetical protein